MQAPLPQRPCGRLGWDGMAFAAQNSRAAAAAASAPSTPAGARPRAAEAGVVGPLPGVIGSMMALEAVKLIAGVGENGAGHVLRGEMVIFDGLWGESRKIAVKRRADCPVCGAL